MSSSMSQADSKLINEENGSRGGATISTISSAGDLKRASDDPTDPILQKRSKNRDFVS